MAIWKPHEGCYVLITRVDTTARHAHQFKRRFKTQVAAQKAERQVQRLVELAGDDDELRLKIGDLIVRCRMRGGSLILPDESELRRKLGAGNEPQDVVPTLADWLDTWLAAKEALVARGRKKASTLAMYRADAERFWKPHLGGVRLDRLRAEHVSGVLDWIERRNEVVRAAQEAGRPVPPDPLDRRDLDRNLRPTGPSAQLRALAVLRGALNDAGSGERPMRRFIRYNPVDLVALPHVESREYEVWSPENVAAFLAHVEHDRLATLWHVLVLYGLRRGEAVGLRWQDLDLDRQSPRLRVEQQLIYLHGRVIFDKPKTDKSRRKVGLDPSTVAVLHRHRADQVRERLLAGPLWEDHDLVFCRPDGSPIPPYEVTHVFKKLVAETDLPPLRLHDTRHTYASFLDEAGVDLKTASELLGHSSTKTTALVYQHAREARLASAASRVVAMVSGQ